MFDVFTEEIEVQIKKGISTLYWYLGDLEKAWLRAGVSRDLTARLFAERTDDGRKLTKRELMDRLYRDIRDIEYNRRLEISRNFVRYLIEHKNFVPACEKHRIDIAESSALKLRELLEVQRKEAESNKLRVSKRDLKQIDYYSRLSELNDEFIRLHGLEGQPRGYAFEKFFNQLMKLSKIEVHEPFRIIGEQIDGAIKHGSDYYLVELKWEKKKAAHPEISSLYVKIEGKLAARGIFIAMNGYSDEILQSLPKGKNLTMLLFDGVHLANVMSGLYSFNELLDRAIAEASLRGNIYCPHTI